MLWLSSLVIFLAMGWSIASKILIVVPMSARSHVMLFEPLVEELARRGHQVTYVTGLKPKTPVKGNVELITLPPPSPAENDKAPSFFEFRHFTAAHNIVLMPKIISSIMPIVIESEPFQNLLKEDRQFDVVIAEAFLSECIAAGLAHKYQAPLIGYGTFMPSYWVNYMVGNEAPSSYIPDPLTALPTAMTFWQRLWHLVFNVTANIWHQWQHLGTQDVLMRRYFGENLPYVGDIIRNTSLLFVNDHYSVSFPRPAVPNIISIGGVHIKPPKPLPSHLQKYLDESKNGAILFSLGSNLKSSEMGPERIQMFLNVFAKLKQNVLWKFEVDLLNKPKNVITSEWLPQSDVLAHPNLRLFITHGGLLSTTEAVDRGVPVVGIPIFGDQPMNMKQSVNAGVGLALDYDNLTEDALLQAITEVLDNPKYTKAAKARSNALKDVLVKPLDLATWWIEYVIRNKGAPQLRSVGLHLHWYQRENIDVLMTITILLAAAIYVTKKIVLAIFRCACQRKIDIKKKNS